MDAILELQQQINKLSAELDRLRSFEWPTYAEGTWTPVLVGTTGAGTYTYVTQVGRYTRIGNIARIEGHINISAITGAPTGNMTITGLPFTSVNVLGTSGGVSFQFISQLKYTAASLQLLGLISVATSAIALYEVFTNAVAVAYPAANFTNAACNLVFQGTYQVSGS